MLVVNAANIEKDWNWIKKNNTEVKLEDISSKTCLLGYSGTQCNKNFAAPDIHGSDESEILQFCKRELCRRR